MMRARTQDAPEIKPWLTRQRRPRRKGDTADDLEKWKMKAVLLTGDKTGERLKN